MIFNINFIFLHFLLIKHMHLCSERWQRSTSRINIRRWNSAVIFLAEQISVCNCTFMRLSDSAPIFSLVCKYLSIFIHFCVVDCICSVSPCTQREPLSLHHFLLLFQIFLFEWLKFLLKVLRCSLGLLSEINMINRDRVVYLNIWAFFEGATILIVNSLILARTRAI